MLLYTGDVLYQTTCMLSTRTLIIITVELNSVVDALLCPNYKFDLCNLKCQILGGGGGLQLLPPPPPAPLAPTPLGARNFRIVKLAGSDLVHWYCYHVWLLNGAIALSEELCYIVLKPQNKLSSKNIDSPPPPPLHISSYLVLLSCMASQWGYCFVRRTMLYSTKTAK